MCAVSVLLVCLLGVVSPAQGAPGELDTGFSGDGMVLTDVGLFGSVADLTTQADGRVVGVGSAVNDLVVARYTAAGGPDPSFGGDGLVSLNFGESTRGRAVRVQPDGRIVVAGYQTTFPSTTVMVVRFMPDGSLDDTFGTGGLVTVDVGGAASEAHDLELLADGRILAAGYVTTGDGADLVLVQLNGDGTPDATFGGGDGIAVADLAGGEDWGNTLARQSDGRIIVGGTAFMDGQGYGAFVARFGTDGAPDTTFGTGGHTFTPADYGHTLGKIAGVGDDDSIILVGTGFSDAAVPKFSVIKFQANGNLATGFGDGGIVTTVPGPGWTYGMDGVVDDQGRILVVGTNNDNGRRAIIIRYLPAGGIDPSYGTDGQVAIEAGQANAAALSSDGSLLVGGAFIEDNRDKLLLAQLKGDDPPLNAPAPPTSVTAVAGYQQLTVSWAAPTDDGNSPITGYTATTQPGGASCATTTTSCVVDGLQDDSAYTVTVAATNDVGTSTPSAPYVSVVTDWSACQPTAPTGYWMSTAAGSVHEFGDAQHHGDLITPPTAPVVDLAAAPDTCGYWALQSDGTITAFGSANHHGQPAPGLVDPNEGWTAISATLDGGGYWVFSSKGRVAAFGSAQHHGDLIGLPLNGAIIDAKPTSSSDGYYLLGNEGGVFGFGDAIFHGSIQGVVTELLGPDVPASAWLNAPIVGLVPTPSGAGYWLVATDGGVFSFGDANFRGSVPGALPGVALNSPINGMVAYGNGYLMVASDGGVFTFSDSPFQGSLGHNPPNSTVITITPLS